MRIKTALTIVCFLFLSFVLLNTASFAVDTVSIPTEVTIGIDTFSQLSLSPQSVEVAQPSIVLVRSYNSSMQPRPNRQIEFFVDGSAVNVTIIQPPPTNSEGATEGSISASSAGTYRVCGKDITGGGDVLIQRCEMLFVTPVAVPNMAPEPQYTAGTENTVSWGITGTNAYQYYVEASTDPTFLTIEASSGWVNGTSATFGGLSSGQIYYYRVKARNQWSGESSWSNSVFSVQEASAPQITLINSSKPAGATTETFNPDSVISLTYRIEDNISVESRTLEVILPNAQKVTVPFTQVLNGDVWSVTIKLGDLPKDANGHLFTAYSFYVEATDNVGNKSWDNSASINFPRPLPEEPVQPTTPPSVPGNPVLISDEYDDTPTWTWVPSYDKDGNVVTEYIIEWCENEDFANCQENSIKIDKNSFTPSSSLALGKWYIRVKGVDKNGIESEWAMGSAMIKEKVSEPLPEKPVEGEIPEEPKKGNLKKWIDKTISEPIGSGVEKIVEKAFGKIEKEDAGKVAVGATFANVTLGMSMVLNLLGTIPYLIIQGSLALLSLLGFRAVGAISGYVYDSITKEPLKQVIIRVYTESGRLIWTDVTDAHGRYKTPEVENGTYYIKIATSGYTFPSTVILGTSDFPLENVYRGAVFKVSNRSIPRFSIPLDSDEATKKERIGEMFLSRTKWVWRTLHLILFIIGLIFSIYAVRINPVWWTYLILALYAPSLILLILSFFVKKEKYGVVRNEDGRLVAGLVLSLIDSDFKNVVATRVTDQLGRYRFLVDNGKYTLRVSNPNYVIVDEDKYKSIYIAPDQTVVLSPDLVVKLKD